MTSYTHMPNLNLICKAILGLLSGNEVYGQTMPQERGQSNPCMPSSIVPGDTTTVVMIYKDVTDHR